MCIYDCSIINQQNGLCFIESDYKFEYVTDKISLILKNNGMKIFDQISHSKGAENAGYTLQKTQLILFGSPKVGTLLMQSNITVAIDLPQKILITVNKKNKTVIYFNDPAYIAKRHDITDCDPQNMIIKKMIINAISTTLNLSSNNV